MPDTQGTLKTKLVEHAQVIFEILDSQQKLLGKEVKGQDYKHQRLMLKRALKGKSEYEHQIRFHLCVPVPYCSKRLAIGLMKPVLKCLYRGIYSGEINASVGPSDIITGGQ